MADAAARRNIAAHYEYNSDFFRPWLTRCMNYSSALFDNCDTLEQARSTIDRTAVPARPQRQRAGAGNRRGWDAFAEQLIRHYGANVFGITLSTEQLAYAHQRLAGEVELTPPPTPRLQDYRERIADALGSPWGRSS